MLTKIDLQTPPGEGLVDITARVEEAVRSSGIAEGLCAVFVPHTTAGLAVNSAMDQNTLRDIREELHRLVPTRLDFHHIYDTPADAAGHIKSVLVGAGLTLIVSQSRLLLGGSQSILFFEFDGPRDRQVWVRTIGDSNAAKNSD